MFAEEKATAIQAWLKTAPDYDRLLVFATADKLLIVTPNIRSAETLLRGVDIENGAKFCGMEVVVCCYGRVYGTSAGIRRMMQRPTPQDGDDRYRP